ncbi:hypothetical protein V7654_15340 [Bacillus sp. JJ1609]|uniref:hypothetical protein n=1 Tax=Bacillus sp. JJ1609 TaxID=3122977 RepID=UPI0030008C54
MANNLEKYLWLIWMSSTTFISYLFLSLTVTIAFFLAGLALVCKSLIDDYLEVNEDGTRE